MVARGQVDLHLHHHPDYHYHYHRFHYHRNQHQDGVDPEYLLVAGDRGGGGGESGGGDDEKVKHNKNISDGGLQTNKQIKQNKQNKKLNTTKPSQIEVYKQNKTKQIKLPVFQRSKKQLSVLDSRHGLENVRPSLTPPRIQRTVNAFSASLLPIHFTRQVPRLTWVSETDYTPPNRDRLHDPLCSTFS